MSNKQEPFRTSLVDQLSDRKSSPLQKYRRLFVGEESLSAFLRYEILTFLFGAMSGALGLLLRKRLYPYLFCETGQNVTIGSHVTLRCPGRINLACRVFVDDYAVLDAKGANSRITLGVSTLIGRATLLSCSEGSIEIGNKTSLGPQCSIRAGLGPIQIGSDVTIGAGCIIVSGSPDWRRMDIPMKNQIGSGSGVSIGDDVWIGVGARIIDGVTIGTGSVIGAGAVVIQDIPDFAIAAGVPAKVIGSRRDQPEPKKAVKT